MSNSLTHGPPLDILDRTIFGGRNAGCPTLAERLPSLKPRLHAFGRIHESHDVVLKAWNPLASETSSGKGPLRSSILNGTSRLKKTIFGRWKGSQGDDPLEAADGKGDIASVMAAPSILAAAPESSSVTPSNGSGDGNSLWIPQLPTSVRVPSLSLSARVRSPSGQGPDSGVVETVLVNAANAPMGPRARNSEGRQVQFGEGPFSPVIVDLMD